MSRDARRRVRARIDRGTTRPPRGAALAALAASLAALLGGCTVERVMPADAGLPRPCASPLDCEDGIACTRDTCDVTNRCASLPLDELCAAGETCSPGIGCRAGRSCTSDAECDDGIACTVESCVAGGLCDVTPLDARCAAPTPVCDRAAGCVAASGCASDLDCDDAVACTFDACNADGSCTNDPLDARCAAGERCGASGCFMPRPCTDASECQDGDFCNGAELCVPEFGCAPAAAPRACADTDECTIDTCDAALDMCVFACDRARPACGCPAPPTTCEGTFTLAGTGAPLTFSCYMGRTGFDFSEVTFAFDAGDLVVTPRALYTPGIVGATLSDLSDPRCPDFDAEANLGGGCEEHYRLSGTFTDGDHFTGTLEWWYVDLDGFSCFISGCNGRMSIPVTGTRR